MIVIKEIAASDTWDIRHRVMWPSKPLSYVQLAEDEEGLHFGLFYQDKMVSIVSLFKKERVFQFRKLATEVNVQGKGFASRLINHVFDYAKEQNGQKLWCNARANKTAFYERLGLQKTDKRFSKGGLDYVIMEKEIRSQI